MRARQPVTTAPGRGAPHRGARALSRWIALPALAVLGATAAAQEFAGDANRGRLLYENHCQDCHTSRAHVRANRKAETSAQVRGWVARWQANQGLDWSAAELDDVTAWLYLRFYDPDRPRDARAQ